jgi:ubiquinone/menaquinone biosynthesis C-methylase UbiE
MRTDSDRHERDIVAWNEAMVERYDIERYYGDSHALVRWIEHRRLALLRSCARAGHGHAVLEVGCGAGHVLERFPECTRTGVDLSPAMLQRARSRLGPAVTLLRGSAEILPLADRTFDIVLCTEVLEHVLHPDRALRELMRVVKADGRVLVSIPNERNIDRAKRLIRSVPVLRTLLRTLASEDNEWHLHRFDADMLRGLAAGAAHIESLHAIPFGILPVRYVAVLRPLSPQV